MFIYVVEVHLAFIQKNSTDCYHQTFKGNDSQMPLLYTNNIVILSLVLNLLFLSSKKADLFPPQAI